MAAATLPKNQREHLLKTLEERFKKNMQRHHGLEWIHLQARLEQNKAALWSLSEMERTGGEPDVVGKDAVTGEYIVADCSAESPPGRRSLCYSPQGQLKREKEGISMAGNVLDRAAAMGIELLTEEQYQQLQKLGSFDCKSQSWLKTPADMLKLGGAIFGDRRFGRVFVYHNTAPCFYRVRGFRGARNV